MKRFLLPLVLLILLVTTGLVQAQAPERYNTAELHEAIKKLNFLGSALYVAAHPDDENTRLIAYLSNVVHANTAYLSLTRGDGGQNLIGPEIRELLGVIRTQELLAARRTDGGQQMFSRANDFGYSKHPDETFAIWNKEEVLSDVVWAMRKWQPDVIINRFDHRTPGRTHGHHTGSAMLSVEAFDMVGDKTVYPEQLRYVDAWQPKRLFFNTSWWFYGSRKNFEEADKSKMVKVDAGTYLSKLGLSVTEIAASSRSQHKSQGFGSSGTRGRQIEYVELIKGDMPTDTGNLFDGINTTWTRVKGGAPIGELLAKVEKNFDFDHPEWSIPNLVKAQQMIKELPDGYWKRVKLAEIEKIIIAGMGLFLEGVAPSPTAAPGETINIQFEATNRSPIEARLTAVHIGPFGISEDMSTDLKRDERVDWEQEISLPKDASYSNPYWLNEPGSLGMYKVDDQMMRGVPENPAAAVIKFDLELRISSESPWLKMPVERPLVYKTTDPVKGEVYKPFVITPPVFVKLDNQNYVFADQKAQTLKVTVTAGADNLEGRLKVAYPNGWTLSPEHHDFSLARKGAEEVFQFQLTPPAKQEEGLITPFVLVDGKDYHDELIQIEYDHIPTQTVFKDATTKVVRIDLKRKGEKIGYLPGAGDDLPSALEQIGYQVHILEDKDFTENNLDQFDAILLGVRAYNTVDRMPIYHPKLLEYVKTGGTLVVQYNTNRRLKVDMEELGPYPLKVSRDRVTDEYAEVRLLAPDHPVLNTPNKITAKDFEGWVQERGLYFPNEWSDEYTAILSSNDKGEPARDGGLLVAQYGEGHYVYSGYSWFRELPAGVPGAFRLLTNLLSLGN